MPTTTGQLYAMMYGGKNTDVVSLYLSTMAASQRGSAQLQRQLADEVKYLTKEQARYRRDLQNMRLEGGTKEQLYKTLKAYRTDLRVLMGRQNQFQQALLKLEQQEGRDKITIAELKQKAEEEVDKDYILPSSALGEIQGLVNDATYQLSGANAASQLEALIVAAPQYGKLKTPGQKKLYVSQLAAELERVRQIKEASVPAFPLKGEAGKAIIEGIILKHTQQPAILSGTQIQAEIDTAKEEARNVYAGLAEDSVLPPGAAGSPQIQREINKLQKKIQEQEFELGATKLARAEELQASENLQGYLADVQDDFALNQSAGSYDAQIAEAERAELRQIAEAEPTIIDIQTQELLDPAFVQREAALMQARTERRTQPADPMQFLLSAPRLTPFSPAGEVQQFISDLKSGIKKEELHAQLIAEQNPDSQFGQAWQMASPEQKVVMALMPRAAHRTDMKPKNNMEKKAVQAIQVASGAQNIDANNMMRLAKELSNDKEQQAHFVSYILAAQRQKQTAPAEITQAMTEEINKTKKAAEKLAAETLATGSAARLAAMEALGEPAIPVLDNPPAIDTSDLPF